MSRTYLQPKLTRRRYVGLRGVGDRRVFKNNITPVLLSRTLNLADFALRLWKKRSKT